MQGHASARFESPPRSIEHPAHRNLCIRNLFVKPVIERLFVYRTESCMLTGPNVAIEETLVPVGGSETNRKGDCGAQRRRARAMSVAPGSADVIPAASECGGARALRILQIAAPAAKRKQAKRPGVRSA